MLSVAAASAITANFFFHVIVPLFLFRKILLQVAPAIGFSFNTDPFAVLAFRPFFESVFFFDVYNLAKININFNIVFPAFWLFRQFKQYKFVGFHSEIQTNLYYNEFQAGKGVIFYDFSFRKFVFL